MAWDIKEMDGGRSYVPPHVWARLLFGAHEGLIAVINKAGRVFRRLSSGN